MLSETRQETGCGGLGLRAGRAARQQPADEQKQSLPKDVLQ